MVVWIQFYLNLIQLLVCLVLFTVIVIRIPFRCLLHWLLCWFLLQAKIALLFIRLSVLLGLGLQVVSLVGLDLEGFRLNLFVTRGNRSLKAINELLKQLAQLCIVHSHEFVLPTRQLRLILSLLSNHLNLLNGAFLLNVNPNTLQKHV